MIIKYKIILRVLKKIMIFIIIFINISNIYYLLGDFYILSIVLNFIYFK